MALEVHLVGEHHHDLLKNERHYSALQKIKPDAISLEISQDDMARHLHGANEFMASRYGSPENAIFLLGRDRWTRLYSQLSSFGMILAYAKELSLPVHFTDHPDLRQELMEPIVSHLKDVCDIDRPDAAKKDDELWEEILSSPELRKAIFLRALGQSRIQRYVAEKIPPEAILVMQIGLLDVILNSAKDGILSANKNLDMMYYSEVYNSENIDEFLMIKERDEKTAEKILSFEGRIMHCCGLLHAWGEGYSNLYAVLQERGCNVFRHKLIDFDSRPDIEQYKGSVHQLAERCVQLISDIRRAHEKGLSPPDLFEVL